MERKGSGTYRLTPDQASAFGLFALPNRDALLLVLECGAAAIVENSRLREGEGWILSVSVPLGEHQPIQGMPPPAAASWLRQSPSPLTPPSLLGKAMVAVDTTILPTHYPKPASVRALSLCPPPPDRAVLMEYLRSALRALPRAAMIEHKGYANWPISLMMRMEEILPPILIALGVSGRITVLSDAGQGPGLAQDYFTPLDDGLIRRVFWAAEQAGGLGDIKGVDWIPNGIKTNTLLHREGWRTEASSITNFSLPPQRSAHEALRFIHQTRALVARGSRGDETIQSAFWDLSQPWPPRAIMPCARVGTSLPRNTIR